MESVTTSCDVVLRYSAATHVGNVRKINQDAYLAQPPVFLVADGMGGHQAGEIASAIVVEQFSRLITQQNLTTQEVRDCLDAAQQAIVQLDISGGSAPGTTVVAAVLLKQQDTSYWLIVSVGDSRAYQWRGGELEQLTRDHSVVQELLDSGTITAAQAATHPQRHIITRALGATGNSEADYLLIPVVPNSRLVLCSDGVTGEVEDATIGEILLSEPDAESAVQTLVTRAVEAGGRDNATAVVVDVESVNLAATDLETSAWKISAGGEAEAVRIGRRI